jgi:hypothetical protein
MQTQNMQIFWKLKNWSSVWAMLFLLFPFSGIAYSENKWFAALKGGSDPSFVDETVGKEGVSLHNVLSVLWDKLQRGSGKEISIADRALAEISRGILLHPQIFRIEEAEYWQVISNFFADRYIKSTNSKLKRGAAICLRQIRTPFSEKLADENKVPTLKDLTGYSLPNDRL